MIIQTRNILTEQAQKTFLSSGMAAGTNFFVPKNANGLAASWAIQLGETGEEQSEVLVLSGAAGTAGTTTVNSAYEHPTDTPIYAIKYDQIVFERSTAGTAGTAAAMTNGTITIQADHEFTQFDDTTGSTSYAYRTYFRSSGLAANSTESDWITSAGFSFYSLGKMRERIKDKLWESGFLKDDDVIDDWINEWKDEMTNAVISVNEDYALGTVDVAFGTAGLGTLTTGDFKQVKRFEVTYDGSTYVRSSKMDSNDFYPDEQFVSTNPYHNWEGDTIFRVHPGGLGTARLAFYRFGTVMVNDTDELPQPFKSYTKSFVDYGLSQALFLDQKPEWKDKLIEAQNSKREFVSESTPRDKSGQTYIEVVEPVNSEDYNW